MSYKVQFCHQTTSKKQKQKQKKKKQKNKTKQNKTKQNKKTSKLIMSISKWFTIEFKIEWTNEFEWNQSAGGSHRVKPLSDPTVTQQSY